MCEQLQTVKPHHSCRCTRSWFRDPGIRRWVFKPPYGSVSASGCIRGGRGVRVPTVPVALGPPRAGVWRCSAVWETQPAAILPRTHTHLRVRPPSLCSRSGRAPPQSPRSLVTQCAHLPLPQPGCRLSPHSGAGAWPSPPPSPPSLWPARTCLASAAGPHHPARTPRHASLAPAYSSFSSVHVPQDDVTSAALE